MTLTFVCKLLMGCFSLRVLIMAATASISVGVVGIILDLVGAIVIIVDVLVLVGAVDDDGMMLFFLLLFSTVPS